MTDNVITGDTELVLDGQRYSLVFDYAAIERLQENFGGSWETELYGALSTFKARKVCEVVSYGLEARHPGMWTTEKLMALSPPWAQLSAAVTLAMKRAYYGDGDIPKPSGDSARPRMGHRRTRSWWPFGRRSVAA